MRASRMSRSRWPMVAAIGVFVIGMFVSVSSAKDNELNPAALSYQLPNQIKWVTQESGALAAVVRGDLNKPGPYIALYKWPPHHMSHPHWHQNDRFITVLSGTWWVGTGTKFDPNSTVPMPAGTFVTHYAKQVHYDGAKDEETMLEIVGEGPAASNPAEVK